MERSTCIKKAAKLWGSLGMALILLISVATPALALDYLDPTYGPPNGYVTLDGGNVQTILQPDDRLLVLNNGVLSRLMPDGSLDTSFGVNGVLGTILGNSARIAIAPDGKFFVVEVCNAGYEPGVLITRYLNSGQIDPAYHLKCGSNFSYPILEIRDIAVQPDGQILILLFSMFMGDGFFGNSFLIRYNSDGYFDTTFSSNGNFSPIFPPGFSLLGGINLQSLELREDGKILVAGDIYENPYMSTIASLIILLTSEGQYDKSFSRDGMLVPYAGIFTGSIEKLVLQKNGYFLAMGQESVDGASRDVILGFTGDGGLDFDFGEQGKILFPDKTDGLIVLLDDSFFVTDVDLDTRAILIRHFTADGQLDYNFGNGGIVNLDGAFLGWLSDLHLQSNGQVLLRLTKGENEKTNIARLDGSLTNSPIFSDVDYFHWARSWIEGLYRSRISGGCETTPLSFCPDALVTRAQLAVLLLRARYGGEYTPPPATGSIYEDIPAAHWAATWIEQIRNEGIMYGCETNRFCPDDPVTRDQMAVFLLRAKYGYDYLPPYWASGIFKDVPADYWAAAWIEEIYREGITSGCGGVNYCPSAPVTRDQMAVFLVRTFNLP